MNKKYKRPSTTAFVYFAICIGAIIYSLISISSYIEKGYVVIRYGEITGVFAIAIICAAVITAIVSGYMFKATRNTESEEGKAHNK